MGPEEEVSKIGKKLEKMVSTNNVDADTALDLLNALKDIPMTLNALQKTRIGMTVNNFRKACDQEEVVTLSKSLIKGWKKLLDQGAAKEKSSSSPPDSKPDKPESVKSSVKQTSFPAKPADTNDSVRIKCREMVASALKAGEPVEGAEDPDELAIAIEDCIYTEFMATDNKYKNRVRSRIANLKDGKNPQLRVHVLTGLIPPERIASMTSEEMASDEMKKIRDKLTKEAINDHQLSQTGGTKSELLKCGKCGKKNCTYNQVQTRSADEPMTTFVYCNECGNRWKFC